MYTRYTRSIKLILLKRDALILQLANETCNALILPVMLVMSEVVKVEKRKKTT